MEIVQDPRIGVLIKSVDKLKDSIEESSRVANKLSGRIVWLTWIITIATLIGVATGVWAAFFK